MGKLGFFAGMAAGYVLGARAGKQRYAQIKTVSGKVWNSQPVQKQVASAKEAARTKAAPVVADLVGDAAKTTAARLRAQRTVASETISSTAAMIGTSMPRRAESSATTRAVKAPSLVPRWLLRASATVLPWPSARPRR